MQAHLVTAVQQPRAVIGRDQQPDPALRIRNAIQVEISHPMELRAHLARMDSRLEAHP
jgi:hypothetical protein